MIYNLIINIKDILKYFKYGENNIIKIAYIIKLIVISETFTFLQELSSYLVYSRYRFIRTFGVFLRIPKYIISL